MEASSSSRPSARSERTTLTRRYALILGLAYCVLVAAAVGFFLLQTDEREKAEWAAVAGRVKEHALILDALAGAVAERVRELQDEGAADIPLAAAASAIDVDESGRLLFR